MAKDVKASTPKRTILYYPTISVPTSHWLRRSLLYWDEIGSIVPRRYEEETANAFSSEIDYLKAEGEFRPFYPEELVHRWDKVQELVKELRDTIESPKFRGLLPRREMRHQYSRIHVDKVSDSVVDYLQTKGLAQRDKEDWNWIKCENRTALLYMAVLAKYLADEDSMSTVPGTDFQEFENLIYRGIKPSDGFACLTTNYLNVVPVPREDVPLRDILNFKRKHRVELLAFREQLNEFQKSLRTCQNKAEAHDIAATFSEKTARGLADLQSSLEDSKLATVAGSFKTIIKLDSPSLWATAALLLGQATQIADIPVQWSMAGVGMLGAIEMTKYLADKRNEERATLRDSAFAYLYHAKRKRILT